MSTRETKMTADAVEQLKSLMRTKVLLAYYGARLQTDLLHLTTRPRDELADIDHAEATRDATGLVNTIADVLAQAGYEPLADDFRVSDEPSTLEDAQQLLLDREQTVRRWTDPERIDADLDADPAG